MAAPPKLPTSVYDAFVNEGYEPTLVVIVKAGGDHEIFEVPGFALTDDVVDVGRLKIPEVTIQDASASCTKVTCGKYGCVTSPC